MRCRFTAGVLTIALCAGMLAVSVPPASASSKGRRNTTLGLGAVAVYELLRGQTGTGLLAGAGAAYAYKKYNDARKDERGYGRYDRYRRDRRSAYRSRRSDNSYYGDSGYQYAPSSYSSDNGYSYQRSGSYTTDTWGSRHYYDPRSGDGYHQYGVGYSEPRYRAAGYRSGYDNGENCPPQRYHRGYRN